MSKIFSEIEIAQNLYDLLTILILSYHHFAFEKIGFFLKFFS